MCQSLHPRTKSGAVSIAGYVLVMLRPPLDDTPIAIPASDQTWLHMDRPNNLMHVHSVLWLDGEPTWDRLLTIFQDRVIDRFPVFSSHPELVDGEWHWVRDPDFTLNRHVRRHSLPGARSTEELQAFISSRFSQPLDREHALWSVDVISDVREPGQPPRTVALARFHHALADGIRLVQVMLSMCDVEAEDAVPAKVGRSGPPGWLEGTTDAVRHGAADSLDVMRNIGSSLVHLPRVAVSSLTPRGFEAGMDLLAHPIKWLDVANRFASEDNQSANTLTEVTRILTAGRSVKTAWSGTPSAAKQVAWVTDLELGPMKLLGREQGATVNDVLLAIISRALTGYLGEREALVDEIHWLVPVSLTPLDTALPADLGNHFSLIFVGMPLGISDPAELIDEMRSRMNRLKHSATPVITFGVQWLVAETPQAVSTRLTNLFANKGVGVLTNVPGPRRPMTFAGVRVTRVLGWAPTSGDQPLSLCIYSYNGQVSVGIACDEVLVPDAQRIAELIKVAHDEMVG